MFSKEFIILDGAMGTMLQKKGLQAGERPDLLSITNPNLVYEVHKEYVDAGSDIIYANTFGANRKKLANTGYSVKEVVSASIGVAKRAVAHTDKKVALDIGPIGELMQPSGELSFDEAYDIFKEMIEAGVEAGADLVVFETMTDLYEVRAGVLAAKENSNLPVFVTMTFEQSGRTFTGCRPETMAITLTALGVDALGANCSLGPAQILDTIKSIRAFTDKPIIVKANAGLPDSVTGEYTMLPTDFAKLMSEAKELDVQVVGGCCGTNPDFIRELKLALQNEKRIVKKEKDSDYICSSTSYQSLSDEYVVLDCIGDCDLSEITKALNDNDVDYVLSLAFDKMDEGAEVLSFNFAIEGVDEAMAIKNVVPFLQTMIHVPFQIEVKSEEAFDAVMRYYNGAPIIKLENANNSKCLEKFQKKGVNVHINDT